MLPRMYVRDHQFSIPCVGYHHCTLSVAHERYICHIRMVCVIMRNVSPIRPFARDVRTRCVVVKRDGKRPSCLIDMLASPAERGSAPAAVSRARSLFHMHQSVVQLLDLAVPTCAEGLWRDAPSKHNKGSNVATLHRVICFPARCLASTATNKM